jgi:hypothetical protein
LPDELDAGKLNRRSLIFFPVVNLIRFFDPMTYILGELARKVIKPVI